MEKTLLKDRSIDLLCALRVGDPTTYAEQDRENIERGLALLGSPVIFDRDGNYIPYNPPPKAEVTYKEHSE